MRLLVGSPSSNSRQRAKLPGPVHPWEFAPGQQAHLGHGVQAALAVGVEGADAVDLVVEQIHTVGLQGAHGEQVDQAAAHRVFARAYDLGHMNCTPASVSCALNLASSSFCLTLNWKV